MNPTHLSDEYARKLTESRKVSGHSMWGGALISCLLGNELPGPGTVYDSQNLVFFEPIGLGDTLTATITAVEKYPEDQRVVFDCKIVNQRNEMIISGVAAVRAPTRKASGEIALDPMTFRPMHAFHDLIDRCLSLEPISMAVCHPCSEEALKGAVEAAEARLIAPILIGPQDRIRALAEELNIDIGPYQLIDPRTAMNRRPGLWRFAARVALKPS